MTTPNTVNLAAILDAQQQGQDCPSDLPADHALWAGHYVEAAEAYGGLVEGKRRPGEALRAKYGYTLIVLGRLEEGRSYLTRQNVGAHPAAKAALGHALFDDSRGFATTPAGRQKREAAIKLLADAVAAEDPGRIAYSFVLRNARFVRLPRLDIARRAAAEFPDVPFFASELAFAELSEQEFTPPTALLLERHLQASAGLARAAYEWAVASGDWTLAENARDTIERTCQPRADVAASVLGAHLDLVHGLATNDASKVQSAKETLLPRLDQPPQRESELSQLAMLTCAAAATTDTDLLAKAASQLLGAGSSSDFDGDVLGSCTWLSYPMESRHDSSDWDVVSVTIPLLEMQERILQALREPDRTYLETLFALFTAADDPSAVDPDIEIAAFAPTALQDLALQALIGRAEPDLDQAGRLLARLSTEAERRAAATPDPARASTDLAEYLVDTLRANLVEEDIRTVMEAATLRIWEDDDATGRPLLTAFEDLLRQVAPGCLKQLAEIYSARTGQPAPVTVDPLQAKLARYPGPEHCPTDPAELSLVQAAVLIALLRGEVDTTRWTVAPFGERQAPFEPGALGWTASGFRQVLFGLADFGVIGFSPSTPGGVLTVTEDGALSAYLDRVVWSISPRTLELQRNIRDLPRSAWPDSWTAAAAIVARELAAAEVYAYLRHQCDQRDLPLPAEAEVMTDIRELLERKATAIAIYLANKTARDALDYRTKHRAGERQVATRIPRLLRLNIEKCLEHDWDTAYRRDQACPESQVFSALHDVLTGWGKAAFERPIFELRLTPASNPG